MRRWVFVLGAMLVASAAMAQDWTRLKGEDLVAAFQSRTLQFDYGAIQDFKPSGATTYENGTILDGFWWIDNNLLCTLWPSSERKNCYSVERSHHGLDLRLKANNGGTLLLRYIDLQ
jgi:hypothetical protein